MRYTLIALIALLVMGCDAVHHPPRQVPVPPMRLDDHTSSAELDSLRVTVQSMQRQIDRMQETADSAPTTQRTAEIRHYPPINANVEVSTLGVRVTSDWSFIDTQARNRRPEIQYYPEFGGQKPVGNLDYVVIPATVGGYTFDIIPNGTLGPIEVRKDGVLISRGTRFWIDNDRHNDNHRIEVMIGQVRQYRVRTYHDDGHRRVLMSQVDRDSTIWFPINFQTYCKNGL